MSRKILAALVLATAAHAQEPGRPPRRGGPDGGIGNFLAPQILAAVDTNKDGRISPDEAVPRPSCSSDRRSPVRGSRSTPMSWPVH